MSRSETAKRCPSEAPKSSKWCEEQRERIYQWKPWDNPKSHRTKAAISKAKAKALTHEALSAALALFGKMPDKA